MSSGNFRRKRELGCFRQPVSALNTLYKMQLSEPAKRGDVLLANWKESGIDVIFSADFK